MPLGLTPFRGNWESRWFQTTSTATFPKGALVNLGTTHLLKEWESANSAVLGIALSYSTQSTKIGGNDSVMVAIPAPGCTAMADLGTGFTTSVLSIGQRVTFEKDGNYNSFATRGAASRFSNIAFVAGGIQTSGLSRIEVGFVLELGEFYSSSSLTLP